MSQGCLEIPKAADLFSKLDLNALYSGNGIEEANAASGFFSLLS